MSTDPFTIEDAFESEDEDSVRVYGSTKASAPLHRATTGGASGGQNVGISQPPGSGDHMANVPYSAAPTHAESLDENYYRSEREYPECQESLLSGERQGSSPRHSAEAAGITTKFTDKRWWRHPKVREHWRVVVASFVLLFVGLGLILTGVAIEITGTQAVQSFIFFIAGAICLIPGAYHVVYIYCAVKGRNGFSLYNLPVFK